MADNLKKKGSERSANNRDMGSQNFRPTVLPVYQRYGRNLQGYFQRKELYNQLDKNAMLLEEKKGCKKKCKAQRMNC